jgi:hypothetical protein
MSCAHSDGQRWTPPGRHGCPRKGLFRPGLCEPPLLWQQGRAFCGGAQPVLARMDRRLMLPAVWATRQEADDQRRDESESRDTAVNDTHILTVLSRPPLTTLSATQSTQ